MRVVIFSLLLLLLPSGAHAGSVRDYLYECNEIALVSGLEGEMGIRVNSDSLLNEEIIKEYVEWVTDRMLADMNNTAYKGLEKELDEMFYDMTYLERRAASRWRSGKSHYGDWDAAISSWMSIDETRLDRFNNAIVRSLR